jgi:hypothetical protein
MSTLELAALPLDVVRRRTLDLATRSPALLRLIASRRARVASLASAHVLAIFVLSVLAPVGMFFVGPLVFGVPHLAADVRYLVLRQRLPKRFVALTATSAAVIVAVRSLALLGVPVPADACEAGAGGLWMLSALLFAAKDRKTLLRSFALFVPIALVVRVAMHHPHTANIAMMHVHNVIGIATWLFLYPRKKAWEILPALAVALGIVVIASGTAAMWTYTVGGDVAFGTRLFEIGRWLAPGIGPRAAASVVIAFVFLQAVHYAIWLAWIPQEYLAGEGTPTFRMTARGLVRDFGGVGCGLIAASTLALMGLALVRIGVALNGYLTLSRFHGLLELAVIAFLVVRGDGLARGPKGETERAS